MFVQLFMSAYGIPKWFATNVAKFLQTNFFTFYSRCFLPLEAIDAVIVKARAAFNDFATNKLMKKLQILYSITQETNEKELKKSTSGTLCISSADP